MKPKQYFLLALFFSLFVSSCKEKVKNQEDNASATMALTTTNLNGKVTLHPKDCSFLWRGYKLLGHHKGSISLKEGYLVFDNGDIVGGHFIMDMQSISATELMEDPEDEEEDDGEEEGHDDRDDLANHLKNPDFFNAKKFPTAIYHIHKIKQNGLSYVFEGPMTIGGKANDISFEATQKNNGLQGTLTIDRTQFGIKYGSGNFFQDLGDNIIKDNFELDVHIKFPENTEH